MLKNKIYNYFTREIIKSFLTILFALSIIAWTVRAVSFLDLIVDNGHSVTTYLLFSLFNITNIITKFAPLSFLIALVLTILRFEKQNELLILWTTGISKIRLANLFLLISFMILLFQVIFATFVTPTSLNKSRSFIRDSDLNSLSSIIKANDFSDSFKNITFYVEKKNINNEMENIFIRDENNTFSSIVSTSGESSNTTIIAEKGFVDKKKLILSNGIIQSQDKKGELNNIYFKKTALSINSLAPRTITAPKLQETSTGVLIKCIIEIRKEIISKLQNCPKKNMTQDITSTLLRRIGMPLYIPLIGLICCFILIAPRNIKFKNVKKYIYFSLGFIILVFAEVLVRFSGFSLLYSGLYLGAPLILTPLTYLILLKRFRVEKMN